MNVKKNKKGFTLMEMLIVVAIIAVLVAIAIPVLSNNLHKAKVATDWANLRSYYAYLQAYLLQNGEYVDEIDGIKSDNPNFGEIWHNKIVYPDGTVIPMKLGEYLVRIDGNTGGYQIIYTCGSMTNLKPGHDEHFLTLGIEN